MAEPHPEPRDERTLAFYDGNAAVYAERAHGSDVRDRFGRLFCAMSERKLHALAADRALWQEPQIGRGKGSGYDNEPTDWLLLSVRRQTWVGPHKETAPMPRAQVRDIEIHYERKGPAGRADAPRLLFISGSGGDLRFKPATLGGAWPDHFDTLCYDQRGLGQTSKPDKPYTMQDYADDAAGIMAVVGWASARVIGVSFGGMVAQELAIRHPSRVERLCLACTSPGGAGGASYPLHELAHLSPDERARKMMQIADTRHDEAWAGAHPEAAKRALALSHDPYADEPGRAIGARRQIEARRHHDVWDRLSDIRAPTLIAAGRYDGLALPATQERMLGRIKGAKLRFFEGGHGFLQDDPAAIPAIIAFLEATD